MTPLTQARLMAHNLLAEHDVFARRTDDQLAKALDLLLKQAAIESELVLVAGFTPRFDPDWCENARTAVMYLSE